jgi:hypothetical protein
MQSIARAFEVGARGLWPRTLPEITMVAPPEATRSNPGAGRANSGTFTAP